MYCEAIHCPETDTVRFAIYPDGFDGPRIIAHVSDEALQELFSAADDDESLVEACDAHFDVIEATALARYRAAPFMQVILDSADFPLHSASHSAASAADIHFV